MNQHMLTWKKSSYSGANGNCVEVAAPAADVVATRDSKQHGSGPVLAFEAAGWSSFVQAVKSGEFDRLV